MQQFAQHLSLGAAQTAQAAWAQTSIRLRLQWIRAFRHSLAESAHSLLAAFPVRLARSRADSLTAEIIPLAEACRFLELQAERILLPQKLPASGRPLWLRSVHIEVHREPFGVVLLIGPANYPLFLVGVQALQALVSGNAVVIKPGREGGPVAQAFADLACRAGLPPGLLTVLDESVEAAADALHCGVNKVVLTGSLRTGHAVLREAAGHVIPVTAELSGFDPVFIQPGADLRRAAAALAFASNLNGGETCIAPHQIYAHHSIVDSLRAELRNVDIPITAVAGDDEALQLAARSPYALGAAVFGEEQSARDLAGRVNAGVVVINDLIVPTADPRVPFGGRGASGYGTTRGALGLLEMTTPKAIVVQRGKRLRHLEPALPNAEEFFLAYLAAAHADSFSARIGGWRRFIKAISLTRKVKQ